MPLPGFLLLAVLTLPPALVARMATTIDSISGGRFGINIVSGWQKAEYEQMGLWPGDDYFGYRYDYSTEYVQVMKELWATGESNFKGKYFTMADCAMKPLPSTPIKIVAAGQSGRGMEFAANHCDYNFVLGTGINTPTACRETCQKLVEAAQKAGRDVGAYVLFMVIAEETDALAQAKWKTYRDGADIGALWWMADQGGKDTQADASGTAATMNLPEGAVNFNMGTLVGSYASVAAMLDQMDGMPGCKGLMLTFDDFLVGLDQFGDRIQPLMTSRLGVTRRAA